MSTEQRKRLSKFLSYVLRHQPGSAGLTLDDRGFCAIDEVVAAARKGTRVTIERADLEALAEPPTDPAAKQRFQIEGDFIRAGHGHTVAIDGYREVTPDRALFHATTAAAMPAIERDGLLPMARQKVHLSSDRAITVEAARRRSPRVVVIEIAAPEAAAAGVGFYESADARIVLSDAVPPAFLRILKGEGAAEDAGGD